VEELEVRAEDFAEDFAHLLQILPAHNRAIAAAAAAAAVAHVAVVADCLHHGHGHDHYDHHRLSVSQNGRVSCDPAGSAIVGPHADCQRAGASYLQGNLCKEDCHLYILIEGNEHHKNCKSAALCLWL
tara:strand:- start:13 stop:396 length:384 start_codon:yes stop_codon:yes gene_type:complete